MEGFETIDSQAASYLIDPDELQQRIAASDNLIMLPTFAVEAMELANDPDCSIPAFVKVIESDTSLVADILSMSNSVIYGARSQVKSVQHAVVCLGMSQCENLIVSSCVKALSRKLPPSVEWSRDVLWQHNIQTATIARYANKTLSLGFEGEEFSGAMIHDIGRMIIAAAAPDVFETVDRLTFCEHGDVTENERALMRTDHCEVGAEFAKSSGLPAALVDVVRFHHRPADASENTLLVHLVAAADHMANHLMFAGEAEGYDSTLIPSLQAIVDASKRNIEAEQLAEDAIHAAVEATENENGTVG